MSSTIDLKSLGNYYHFFLSSYQSLGMCLYDLDSIREGKSIGYGIDGYDLCRYLFPPDFFKGRPNPHHEVIRSNWDYYFKAADGETTFAIMSPLTVVELLATIEERASGKALGNYLGSDANALAPILRDLANGIKALDQLQPTERQLIDDLNRLVRIAESARKVLFDGKSIQKLHELMQHGKLRPLDPMLREAASGTGMPQLFADSNQQNVTMALDYLARKRGKMYSEFSVFYNKLDVYHYVLFENVDTLLHSKGIQTYVSSSGILSRNSWLLTKYGKLPNDIAGIPSDWAARSSDVPNFLMRVLEHFRQDTSAARDFVEEGHALCRVVLRDFHEIPELAGYLSSPTRRQELLADNPEVTMKNKTTQAILRFQNEYHKHLVAESARAPSGWNDSPGDEIDVNALWRWISDPKTRSEEYRAIRGQVQGELISLRLHPLDWSAYVAPLGETAFEILHEFDSAFDV